MTVESDFRLLQLIAAQDLSVDTAKFKMVSLSGVITNNPRLAAGILRHGAPSSKHVSVVCGGITKAYAAAAISTVGYPIAATTSGWITAAVSGGVYNGRALDTCASGDLVRIGLNTLDFPRYFTT